MVVENDAKMSTTADEWKLYSETGFHVSALRAF
jgi:hypothetical protein